MDQNQRRARITNMRKGRPIPRPTQRPADPEQSITSVSYFIQSRPHPSAPWEQPGLRYSCESKETALEKLAARREMQPGWEHRLMERVTTVTERPATED